MLQPRLSVRMTRWSFVLCAVLLSNLVRCQEIYEEEQIESSRIKREGVPDNRDLTVLLVNQKRNDYNTKIGRYHSVKPLIGLLTSTARTFIQDGVTTEFATQILGTTLDNGRIYAQLLTKSSLVLYNKPSNVEEPIIVHPTRIHSAFDGEWNVKQDLGFIDPEKFVLKNTDYLAPSSKMEIVYASKPTQEAKFWSPPSAPEPQVESQVYDEPVARRVQPVKEISRYIQNEAYNFLDGPAIEGEKKFEFYVEPTVLGNVNTFHRQSKAYEPVTEPVKVDIPKKDLPEDTNIVKIKPNYDLPTFTIKNEFSPIFYYIDNVESRKAVQPSVQQTKLPKKLFGQKSEPRPKKTFTYAGFADFTTVVGDTVIIFTPNTETHRPPNPDEVNVYPSAKRPEEFATKITFLSAEIPVATSTYKAHEAVEPTRLTTPSSEEDSNRAEKALQNDEDSLKKVLYDVVDQVTDSRDVQYNNDFGLNVDVIQPSETPFTTTESTRITDNLGVIPIQGYSLEATEPLAALSPSSTIFESSQESIATEPNIGELFTNSEEESENTAAEVTEKPEDEEEEEEEEEDVTTTETEQNIITTTESGHSEESSEEFETTTETKHTTAEQDMIEYTEENYNVEHETHEDVFCTDGLETQSTMTTAYKTLTYLTTYFIPLESTETTTSIKSDVVVESNVGYFTNVVCRTNFNIEPTAVVSVDVNYSVQTNVEVPEVVSEEPVKPPTEPDMTTENAKTTIQEVLTTVQEETKEEEEEENTRTTLSISTSQEPAEIVEEKEPTITTTMTTTTTESTTTSQNHVETSVSTERSTTTTEKPTTVEDKPEDEENEIDVIYKTLYTTYTYFTTFFGDETSSVASHKSVVTNVITSTIEIANLDPSLLGVFDEDQIAPTNVGAGRPTESIQINSIIDLVKNKDVIESVEVGEIYNSQTPTPALGDDVVASIKPDGVKTYYTTYTFFTTIFVGSDANVCSRSEVYTNYVGPDALIPTKSNPLAAESTRAQFDFRNCKQVKMEPTTDTEHTSMETSVSMVDSPKEDPKKYVQPSSIEVDMLFSVESNPLESENSYVTDVKSSSSKGERQYLDNNNVLDDQISSESNIDEILPSPTLLLQTSYTTFTYFTTMYIGKDSSKVKSHLETITNVVTETIMPNKESEDESNLPITYYTTFTYWTTLYKDKSTTITSREEIVSNVVTPSVLAVPTVSPIDTTPIEVDSVLPPKELEAELKPSLVVDDSLEHDDGKATFYTTYTYFTTFYAGNTSQIRSSLETVTNIVDNTKVVEDNQIARKVPSGSPEKNLIQDNGDKLFITPTIVKEEIQPTKLPDIESASPTVLLGTYIDNLFAEVKPATPNPNEEKKILFSQVAVISGDSTVVTSENKTLPTDTSTSSSPTTTSSTENAIFSSSPEIIEGTVTEPETTTELRYEEEEDGTNTRKKSRLTFKPKKPSVTPVITPFLSRNRPTFIPKRVPLSNSATTITRLDVTPTITATPTLKSVRQSGFGGSRKQSSTPGLSSAGKRFSGRSSINNPSGNVPSASRPGAFGRGSIQPTSRRGGFRSSTLRSNSLDYASRSAGGRIIRPTATLRLPNSRGGRQSASITFPPSDQNEETLATQQDENFTESDEEITEAPPVRTTNNPLLRFRRPPIPRQPGTAITPRSTTQSARRGAIAPRGRVTTTTRRSTTRSTPNPLLALRRQRPNSLFPRRNLFKQPEPEPEEEIKDDELKLEDDEELLEEEEFEEDNEYDSSDRKERHVASPPPTTSKRTNIVQIRPFAFRRRTKRQADNGNRKYTNFRRPGKAGKSATTRRPDPEPESEAPPAKQKSRPGGRFNGKSRANSNTRTTTASAPKTKTQSRQPFIIRGESRTTSTTSAPAYRRGKTRTSSRTTTTASRPKAPRLVGKSSTRSSPTRATTRARPRTTTSKATSRQRSSFENFSGERKNNYANILNDGKITITYHIPTEVTIPVVNGKITEYKNVLSATPSIDTLLLNQVETSVGPMGEPQLVLATESTELDPGSGATKIIKYLLNETPTTTVIFTPTTIRGRKTSYSHILPSTVYNVEPVTQTIAPEINANVPLANLLLSQLLLGNQQPAINPLLAFQGQGLLPQQQIVQTPVTEYKTIATTYVTTVTDARETVLPITFRGKAILTTIVDPTTNVITATEFVTETIITTPTALGPAPQLNSLLLPLLLQQQQQQQPSLNMQTANPLLGLAFNTNAIIYDNTPWKPGTDADAQRAVTDDGERKFNNLATRIMSNGVEVLVKDKNTDAKYEQRSLKFLHQSTLKPSNHASTTPKQSLLSSTVATIVKHQQISALLPLDKLLKHNYIIKTCMTTYTYLTTIIQNKRSAISTFDTVVSVVTTESLTNLYADDLPDLKPTKTKYTQVKTIQPSSPTKMYMSNFPKADKRIDSENDVHTTFDLIQPSEVSQVSCTTSCSCSNMKTEGLMTTYPNRDASVTSSYNMKTSKYGGLIDVHPTNKEQSDKKTQYGPYEYETNSQLAPTDRIVEKYTEVINDYSDEKDSSPIKESELLTNEQAPTPPKINKINNKTPEKGKPDKQKPNKNKFVVADLLKLGTLGIKGLTQLAPVIEKMTGGFIKRQESANKVTTTTVKPAVKLTAYNVDKRVDSDIELKHNFPIYIPVDELETSESQTVFTNATLHQNLAWAAEHKQPKAHIVLPKFIHESPLVNGGIHISPGEIITTNSDVIVGKPAVGGPLTLAASGIKLQNPVSPPAIDSFVAANEQYLMNEKPLSDQGLLDTKVDDSYDLRPPDLPKMKPKPNRPLNAQRPSISIFGHQNKIPRQPQISHVPSDQLMKTENVKSTMILGNHGRPAFLDYIPSLAKPMNTHTNHHVNFKPNNKGNNDAEIPDNSPSSSEIVKTQIRTEEDYTVAINPESNKPFLVDIQPSRVANVLIPHGSSTALVFAGSSEPHKTGDYVDDPLPYPEPGYFGSFSIDAPQMTNVHNVAPTSNKQFAKPNFNGVQHHYKPNLPQYKEHPVRNDLLKWKDSKRPGDYNKIPPPTSNQETHVQVGPQITSYNPDIFSPTNGDFDMYNQVKVNDNHKDGKKVIDKEYENYLAVPPPPPKMIFNQENSYDKLKPYQQRPIVHTKPVQDMKVFLNIQHPVPQGQLPPKVTSEIYFAAQDPNNKPSPTYTIHIPPAADSFADAYNKQTNNIVSKPINIDSGQGQNHFPIVSSSNIANTTQFTASDNDRENTYTVTLNTATNVASNIGEIGQVIGSSIPVPIESTNVGLNTDIPIGTNFAIKVEDNRPSSEIFNLHGQRKPIINEEKGRRPIDVSVEDNRWNTSSIEKEETTVIGHNYYHQNINVPPPKDYNRPLIPPSLNSHANFPMINEGTTTPQKDVKPLVEYVDDVKFTDQKRPAKLIPNIPTNSHGWYSSVLNENNINNIKIEATTRKIIPIHEYKEKDSVPDFGKKIVSAGKPPTEMWTNNQQILSNFNIGKPFTKASSTEKPYSSIPPLTTKRYDNNYIPSNLNAMQQPAYDIPIRDNSDETTTSTQKPKPIYENSEEVYDGEEEQESTYDNDGAVSLESMKIPVVSSSSELGSSTSSTQITLLQDEVLNPSQDNKNKNKFINFNPGTQTEKPFRTENKTSFQSNTIKPVYANNYYNMKPRPFTVNTGMVLDHQLQQPHWQINHMVEHSSNMSYEDNIDLNIGEKMYVPSTTKPTPTQRNPVQLESVDKFTQPFKPVFTRTNGTQVLNESSIITSTVHIKDKKPLIVEQATEKSTISPIFTIRNDMKINKTSTSEIIDLSPPPPTMDYNFKPSTNDEMIMGMSPPPPRNPPTHRHPARVPLTPRPIPVRTPPPYRPKPQRTLPPRLPTQRPISKPVRDEVSTYRPHIRDDAPSNKPIKDDVSTYRPSVRDEISTYRPAYDILHNIRRPGLNRDQPSSQLLPPPRETPSRIITPVTDLASPTISQDVAPNLVFPTATSSGWLTSSGFDFSSSFNFAPTSIKFPEISKPSAIPELSDVSSSENSYSYEVEYSSEKTDEYPSESPISTEDKSTNSKEVTDSTTKETSSSIETNVSDSIADESAEDATTEKVKIVGHKNRTRKPYPIRNDDRKTTSSKFKLPSKPTSTIRPTRTLARPDIVYPTRHTSINKIVRPMPTRLPPVLSPNIIESSESSIDEALIKPTEVLRDSVTGTSHIEISGSPQPSPTMIISTFEVNTDPINQPVHHAGNEVKISDEPIPTKTEFRTTVITLTKTLSEPPTTISSVDYVNLTHTLTVTHIKTSLVSQSEGAVTETLVLTNTQTSTIVDVVTEIRTQVQPTTIIETVTKHIPVPQVEPTSVQEIKEKTKAPLDDISMSSEENDNLVIRDNEVTENVQKIDVEGDNDNDTFFVVMNKSQNGGQSPTVNTEIETGDYDGITRNEQVNSNGVSQVLFGEILLAGAPYLETTNVGNANGGYGKECHPDCKASRNERCQRIDGIMKCVCRPGFARMFPDRPCKPTYTYSLKLALDSQGNKRLRFHQSLSDNSSKEYQALAVATHEGINRMVMQSDLRDVFHGVHITGFHPVEMKDTGGDSYQGVMNDFYVQLSDNAHENRLKEVIEKYLRNNNYSLGGTDVHAAGELVERLEVSDFDECTSGQFHDCSEYAQCFNLRGTYTCSCLEGYADLSVNNLYPGRICSTEPVGCERCNYHGACYSRDDRRVLCECFQWYAGSTCQINLKVVLISLVVAGAVLTAILTACAVVACRRSRPPQRSIVACIQSMPTLHQGAMPSKQRADRRALISERGDAADASSIQNASLPYMPVKRPSSSKKLIMCDPPAHDPPPPPPAPALMIPRARLHQHHGDSRENIARKRSLELSSEAKLISYLESGASANHEEMRRKHSLESSYSANKDRHNKQGALVSAGFKVSTTIRGDEVLKDDRDDLSSVNKGESDGDMGRFDSLRKAYSQEDLSEWTDAERRLGELTLSEARSVGGTLPASTGRAASSTRLTHQEANTMAERDLGSTFLLPHVHLYKPDLTSDVSEFDSL